MNLFNDAYFDNKRRSGNSALMVFMFSGQGSQFYHMGRELFERYPAFRKWMNELDDLFKQEIGESVVHRIYDKRFQKSEPFDDIRVTHPAIFMVEYALAQSLMEKNITPDFVLGASLGEMTAATVANGISLEKAVKFIVKQADIFDRIRPLGGMLAILADVEVYDNMPTLRDNCEIAAVSCKSHFTVSGEADGLKRVEEYLRQCGILFYRLPVKQAFHSSCIDLAIAEFERQIYQFPVTKLSIPLISCARAKILTELEESYFWEVVRNPILVLKTIQYLEESGDFVYLDLGPSGTLFNLVKQNIDINSLSTTHPIMTPFGQDLDKLETVSSIF